MSEDERKETIKEARILEVLNHPNIVHFREVYKTIKGKLKLILLYFKAICMKNFRKTMHSYGLCRWR
jgi:serine/threonine protein kinase